MKTKPAYDIDYFIRKFSAIPSKQIGSGGLKNQCALFHCGVTSNSPGDYNRTPEALALAKIFALGRGGDAKYVADAWARLIFDVTDDTTNLRFSGRSPKERIMRRLRLAKRNNYATT